MKTLILESTPLINFNMHPNSSNFFVSPKGKPRSQPLLGFNQDNYHNFVHVQDGSDSIKDLLSVEETETGNSETVDSKGKLSQSEKVMKMQDVKDETFKEISIDPKIATESKDYMMSAKMEENGNVGMTSNDTKVEDAENEASLVNISAYATKKAYNPVKKEIPQLKTKKFLKQIGSAKKKKSPVKKKVSSFKIRKK